MRNIMNWIKKYYPTIAISILILALLEIGARLIFSEILDIMADTPMKS